MGNYGRWESYVDRHDPYGYRDEVETRNALRALNEYERTRRASRRDEQHYDRLAKWDEAERERKEEREELGINEYQQQLSKRGLVNKKINHGLGETVNVQGFVDPESERIIRELAAQGLMGENFVSSRQNRAGLRSLYERHKGETKEAQAKAEKEKAIAEQRAHEIKLREMEIGVGNAREDRADAREEKRYTRDADLRRIQMEDIQRQRDRAVKGEERADAAYLSPEDQGLIQRAQRDLAQAEGGDVESAKALRELAKRRPDIAKRMGIDGSVGPTSEKVVSSPAISSRLDRLRQMKLDGANPAEVKAVLDQLWRLAGESEHGPAVMEEAKAIIQGQLGKEMWLDEDERTISTYVNDWWKQ